MAPLIPYYVTAYDKGLINNVKPAWIPDEAFSTLENAFCYRGRILKREGLQLLGRLRRTFANTSVGNSGASPWTFDILASEAIKGSITHITNFNPGAVTTGEPHNLVTGQEVIISGVGGMTQVNGQTFTITNTGANSFTIGVDTTAYGVYTSGGIWADATEPNAEVEPGSVVITIQAGPDIIFTDLGTGILTSATPGNSGVINYITGVVMLIHTAGAGVPTVVSFNYFPSLPVMGIMRQETQLLNDDPTMWFDQKYAYVRQTLGFNEYAPGTTWSGSDSDFFWGCNYRGANPYDKLLFVTNFFLQTSPALSDPIRYTLAPPSAPAWTDLTPLAVTATDSIFQARLIVAYYNRLLLLNTWEGTTGGGVAMAKNYQNRCRFCTRFESPVLAANWATNVFGKGGVIDAPTNEQIVNCMFVKNVLIVQFEQTTWQLTYIGEYGLPFIWERVSADFGSESTFSAVLYENQMLSVGDKAITASNAIGCQRIDLDIPDQVFDFKNTNFGVKRVWGVRDYQKEVIYWNYPDAQTEASNNEPLTFPNKVLLYNYRNNTWAIFRDSVTAFGTYQLEDDDTASWDSLVITWDDNDETWGDVTGDSRFPAIVSGNQQGFVHAYAYIDPDQPSLTIEGIDLTVSPISIKSVNHNLQPSEVILLSGMNFLDGTPLAPVTSNLNGAIFGVKIVDKDNFTLMKWDFTLNQYVQNQADWTPPVTPMSTATYVGGGEITLYPKLDVQTKDINVFQDKGLQTKLAYIDFLCLPYINGLFTVSLELNSSQGLQSAAIGNLDEGNQNVSIDPNPDFYTTTSEYAWFRFFATLSCQYFRIGMTYNDGLMNTATTHITPFTLYGITAYVRPGGKTPFA